MAHGVKIDDVFDVQGMVKLMGFYDPDGNPWMFAETTRDVSGRTDVVHTSGAMRVLIAEDETIIGSTCGRCSSATASRSAPRRRTARKRLRSFGASTPTSPSST